MPCYSLNQPSSVANYILENKVKVFFKGYKDIYDAGSTYLSLSQAICDI